MEYDTGSGWKDGQGGGGRLARIFGDGDNPLRWSLPLYRAWGIAVRVHIIFILVIAARLISTLVEDQFGILFMAVWMAGLFGLVLLHEYGHCIACRKVGGEADEILMWPLGGLASCLPPSNWKAHLVTVLGGPAVNVALLPVFAAGLLAVTGSWGLVFFNPLDLGGAGGEALTHGFLGWTLWSLHLSNVMLLAFNMLVPMYPLDGARVVHALIWRKKGRAVADRVTWTVGFVAAIVLGTLALALGELLLFAIAIFGGLVCFQEQRRQRFMEMPDEDWSASLRSEPEPDREKPERESVDPEEIDRILEKISKSGMQSLTRREKKKLERASSSRAGS